MPGGLCPVCESTLGSGDVPAFGESLAFDCPNCGRFRLTRSSLAERPAAWARSQRTRSVLSHAIRRRQQGDAYIPLTSYDVTHILEDDSLPTPPEMLDLLVELIGQRQGEPGALAEIDLHNDRALLGASSAEGVLWALQSLESIGLAQLQGVMGAEQPISLTLNGWLRLRELRGGRSTSRRAFMAMQYGDAELEGLYENHLKPAVAETGFELYRLNEAPPAGLIDVRLRAELRRARFLIADLTHRNAGAYWEAGFMEGVGKPVIYLCKESVFQETATHFDTNHSQHVLWRMDDPVKCTNELKATIRATLPEEARFPE